jgi:hypothetical protein
MNKPLTVLHLIVLVAVIGLLSSCKKAVSISEADVLGTWEIKAWNWKEPQYYSNYNMLGILVFSPVSFENRRSIRVSFTFWRDGSMQTLDGYAHLANLPVIKFDGFYSSGDSMAFRGIVEDGGMIGFGGFYWDIPGGYGHWEWEAVKK